MMAAVEYKTNRSRASWALVVGSLTGALAVACFYLLALVHDEGFFGSLRAWPLLALIFPCAFLVWAIGLIVFAVPVWWFLHKVGLRSWLVAVIFGALGALLGYLGLEAVGFHAISTTMDTFLSDDPPDSTAPWKLASAEPWNTYLAAILFGLIGAVVGAVIWRKAYWCVEADTN